jgi:Trypsin
MMGAARTLAVRIGCGISRAARTGPRSRQTLLPICALLITGLMLAFVPAAGASATTQVRVRVTRAQLRRARSRAGQLALAHELLARSHRGRIAIVGGTPISSEQAPWQVAIVTVIPVSETEALVGLCGGSILSASEVVSAAHCMFGPLKERILPAQIAVIAGTADIEVVEPEEQLASVAGVRVHPGYNPGASLPSPDDVSVLKLETPLVLSKPTAEAIAPAATSSLLQEGTAVELTGFGEENPITEELNGTLNSIGMSLLRSERCGGEADAVFLCARAPSGSLCLGDSGSGLTIPTSPASQVGVTNTVEGKCPSGAVGGFANATAPEIRDFIEGSESPPRAPRGGGDIEISGVIVAGRSLTCDAGSWTGSPTLKYSFINSAAGQILQTGSSTVYALTAADVGRAIACEVTAVNAGGTGSVRTGALPPIQASPGSGSGSGPIQGPPPPPQPPAASPPPAPEAAATPPKALAGAVSTVALAGTSIAVNSNGEGSVKLECRGAAKCKGKLTLTAKSSVEVKGKPTVRTVPVGSASFSVAGGGTKTVKIKLGSVGRGLLGSGHGRLSARLAIVKLEPAPRQSQVKTVQLVAQKGSRGAK